MRVIATAGHVDHGKSTLVRALTGINPDRLREEQRREMTIDLGFAWLTLGDAQIGVIDVPGHIDFIDNMLAGVGGIDLALLVIAADEGPMPQTREHLAILELLRVERAIVALTKCDMVDDEWVALMRADIASTLAPTPLRDAPIMPVSARAGSGLTELKAALKRALADVPPRRDLGRPRLPIDRAFTMQGFGTIVTGTLVDGALAIGDAVEIVTQRGEAHASHVRGLQTHKQKLERALPGSRVAINLGGVSVEQAARGGVVALPGALRATTLIDVEVDMLHGTALSLKHNAEVKVFSGAAMSVAQAWLLDATRIEPGAGGRVQLQLTTPMALANGDRLVVRLPSPSITLGGATVLDAHPERRYRRRGGKADDDVLARLSALSAGTPVERIVNALADLGFATRADAAAKAQLEPEAAEAALGALQTDGSVSASRELFGLTATWRGHVEHGAALLAAFHKKAPLTLGMSKESLRSQLKLGARDFDALLASAVARESMVQEADVVRLTTHAVKFSDAQQRAVDALIRQCRAQPWNTPLVKDAKLQLSEPVYLVLTQRAHLIQLNDDVFLLPDTYADAVARIRSHIGAHGEITAAQVRDSFNTTRKYALALLEHLDAAGVTKRVGAARVLR
jgi:selenocysteine-specific elongation factor